VVTLLTFIREMQGLKPIWTSAILFEAFHDFSQFPQANTKMERLLDQLSSALDTRTPGASEDIVRNHLILALTNIRSRIEVLAYQKQAQSSHEQVRTTLIIDKIFNNIIFHC
jgi:hypothetical protein